MVPLAYRHYEQLEKVVANAFRFHFGCKLF